MQVQHPIGSPISWVPPFFLYSLTSGVLRTPWAISNYKQLGDRSLTGINSGLIVLKTNKVTLGVHQSEATRLYFSVFKEEQFSVLLHARYILYSFAIFLQAFIIQNYHLYCSQQVKFCNSIFFLLLWSTVYWLSYQPILYDCIALIKGMCTGPYCRTQSPGAFRLLVEQLL